MVIKYLKAAWRQLRQATVYDEYADVTAFNEKFGLPVGDLTNPRLLDPGELDGRIQFINEELRELQRAALARDLPGVADALVDLVYVVKGTAVMMGLPWDDLWLDVQRANLAKVPLQPVAGYKRDIGKPPGWVGPRTEQILLAARTYRDGGWYHDHD